MEISRFLVAGVWLLLVADKAAAASPIAQATSPDGKLILTSECAEFDCEIFLKRKTGDEVLTKFKIEEFDAENSRDTISAIWRNDSRAVALNINYGRSISGCELLVEKSGSWLRVALPEEGLAKVRKDNNSEDGKSQDYLVFKQWLPTAAILSYQGNNGTLNRLACRLEMNPQPHLVLR